MNHRGNLAKINCAFPGHLENGKIFYVGTLAEYTYHPYMSNLGQNKQIRYECDKSFKLMGPNGSTCINGNWKPNIKLVKCVKVNHLSEINLNDTLKTELDENIISIGLKNERKAKSLFRSNVQRRLKLRRLRNRNHMRQSTAK
ncbi:von Willebrand factor type EGF and pentraxin domain-containing 1 [Brachionus plicatilis]|uniref:von Willebrand factor type EGF and pentraxin domain-containing 1 n=1 Tax=Brachionus plicatilis TaxID=10195 RepID=A0A3M7SJ96_BRAPC|nr:von Willebrand factor type EGF and pentraxin domain-containing 1 [Brachionus plicatilis]